MISKNLQSFKTPNKPKGILKNCKQQSEFESFQQQTKIQSQQKDGDQSSKSYKEPQIQKYSNSAKKIKKSNHQKLHHKKSTITIKQSQIQTQFPLFQQFDYFFITKGQQNKTHVKEKQYFQKSIIAFILSSESKLSYQLFAKLYKRIRDTSLPNFCFYNSLVQRTIKEIITSIQQQIKQQFKIDFQPLCKQMFIVLNPVIINSKQVFSHQYCKTLASFINKTFNLKKVEIQAFAIINLYHAFSTIAFKSRQINKKTIRPCEEASKKLNTPVPCKQLITKQKIKTQYKINQIWNNSHENLLIKTYRQNQDFTFICNQFFKRFPALSHIWNSNALRARFYRVMRRILRQLRLSLMSSTEDEYLPALQPLHGHVIQILIRRQCYRNLRLNLLSWQSYELNKQSLIDLITTINKQNEIESQKIKRKNTNKICKSEQD